MSKEFALPDWRMLDGTVLLSGIFTPKVTFTLLVSSTEAATFEAWINDHGRPTQVGDLTLHWHGEERDTLMFTCGLQDDLVREQTAFDLAHNILQGLDLWTNTKYKGQVFPYARNPSYARNYKPPSMMVG
jgi:hypothetical protein